MILVWENKENFYNLKKNEGFIEKWRDEYNEI